MLHKDADNAINCLLNGTKDWILIHPDNEENVSRSVALFILFYFIKEALQSLSFNEEENQVCLFTF